MSVTQDYKEVTFSDVEIRAVRKALHGRIESVNDFLGAPDGDDEYWRAQLEAAKSALEKVATL